MRKISVVLLLLLGAGVCAFAQRFDLATDRLPISDLQGSWRFHAGDDPRWADPRFDDSAWKLLRPDQPWSASGEKNANGFGWYRFTVRIPADMRDPSLYVPGGFGLASYQVYADGRLIGGVGKFPPRQRLELAPYCVLRLPRVPNGAEGIVVAIRIWNWVRESGYGPGVYVRLGAGDQIDSWARYGTLLNFWSMSTWAYLLLVYLIQAAGALLLFRMRRKEREYLWFGAYQFLNVVLFAISLWPFFYSISFAAFNFWICVVFTLKDIVWIVFLATLLKTRRHWAFGVALFSIALIFVAYSVQPALAIFHSGQIPASYFGDVYLVVCLGNIGFDFGILYPLYKAARARVPDAQLLLVSFALFRGAVFIDFAMYAVNDLGWRWPLAHSNWFYSTSQWPFPINVRTLTEFLTQIAMMGILALRFVRSRRDEERLASELEAARAVQHVLVPHEIPAIPGLSIECVYKPAGQVGGDFFQILPLAQGGALVVIGDVSGKGMPAAMTVSLLVGTLRAAAETTTSPAALLAAMNRLLLGRTSGGFTTCLILHIDAEGRVTAANAGHILPYVDGKERAVENGMPLGLSAAAAYGESQWQLRIGEELTLLTDGVVEARNAAGELFGFERTGEIARATAAEIAETAFRFGQDDDITVLRLRRSKANIESESIPVRTEWSPLPAPQAG